VRGDYRIVSRRRPGRSLFVLGVAELNDRLLAARAREGDRQAFQELFERHRAMLTTLIRRAGDTSGAVEDIVQETALSALIGIERLKQPDRFGAWLAGIGLNICRRQRRQELQWQSRLETVFNAQVDRVPDPSEVAIEREIARSVRTAIAELPSGQRQAVPLFYLSGLTYRETALALGIDVGAVRTRLHKARARLGQELSSVWKGEEMQPAEEREMVPVRVADVLRLSPTEGKQTEYVVMLEETGGSRRLPIWVGEPEATWLAYGIEHVELPRPGPYSMLASLLDATGAQIQEVRIERLVESTYYATIVAEGTTSATIDARPSDALNLAVLAGSRVVVASDVLDAAAMRSAPAYERLERQLREGTTVGAATIGSEARIAQQRALEELTGEEH
jgi:RNA polymerase sigma factor (sigma-70 family)